MEEEIRQIYKIANFKFETKEEYMAARRDLDKLADLNIKKDMDYSEIMAISNAIHEEKMTFESYVGEEFLKSLQYRIYQYHKLFIRRALKILCGIVIAGCLTFFIGDGILEYRSRHDASLLQQKVSDSKQNVRIQQGISLTQEWAGPINIDKILPEYKELYKKNANFAGWLRVEGTGLDYPVMQGPDNEFYLSHNMEGEYDKNGLLILDTGCLVSGNSPQYIIYGHNVQSGRMFGELLNYKEEAYYRFHPILSFDSLMERGEYEIVAAFVVSLVEPGDLADFYQYKNFQNQEEFDSYIALVKKCSIYDTGVEPVYGRPLLTLVTCENSVESGRFVVVAGRRPDV